MALQTFREVGDKSRVSRYDDETGHLWLQSDVPNDMLQAMGVNITEDDAYYTGETVGPKLRLMLENDGEYAGTYDLSVVEANILRATLSDFIAFAGRYNKENADD